MRSPPHRGHWFNMAGSPVVRVSCSVWALYSAQTVQFPCLCVLSTSSGITTGQSDSAGLRQCQKLWTARSKCARSACTVCVVGRRGTQCMWRMWCVLWVACTYKGSRSGKVIIGGIQPARPAHPVRRFTNFPGTSEPFEKIGWTGSALGSGLDVEVNDLSAATQLTHETPLWPVASSGLKESRSHMRWNSITMCVR